MRVSFADVLVLKVRSGCDSLRLRNSALHCCSGGCFLTCPSILFEVAVLLLFEAKGYTLRLFSLLRKRYQWSWSTWNLLDRSFGCGLPHGLPDPELCRREMLMYNCELSVHRS